MKMPEPTALVVCWGGWPLDPPNYLAFRYDSRLQTIHHVERWEVVDDLEPLFPELGGVSWIRAYPRLS